MAPGSTPGATGCIGIAEKLRAHARLRDLIDPGS